MLDCLLYKIAKINDGANMNETQNASQNEQKLKLTWLIALVVGSMIGGAVFALPQNLSSGAGNAAVIIGWVITGIGMIALASTYRYLSEDRPDLHNGIYSYAKELGGRFLGFNSSWGYWMSCIIGNVSYAVLLFSAIGYFFPVFGYEGNNLASLIGSSVLVWVYAFLMARGIRQAAFLNFIITACKLVPIVLFIICAAYAFDSAKFVYQFWGDVTLGGIMTQIKSTMLVTLWVFVGIEGAVVESSRAQNQSDVGRATVLGLLAVLGIYVFVTILSMGVMTQKELADLKQPALGYILEHIIGKSGAIIVNIGLIMSLFGAWLGWTMLATQMPYDTAIDGALPKVFTSENKYGTPTGALTITSWVTQLILLSSYLISELFGIMDSYLALVKLGTTCILIPYLLSGLFALKIALQSDKINWWKVIVIAIASLYSVWIIYAAGAIYLLLSTVIYAVGILFFWYARRESGNKVFASKAELLSAVAIVVLSVFAVWYLWK